MLSSGWWLPDTPAIPGALLHRVGVELPAHTFTATMGFLEAGEHSWLPSCFQLALAILRDEISLEARPWVLGSFTLRFIHVP